MPRKKNEEKEKVEEEVLESVPVAPPEIEIKEVAFFTPSLKAELEFLYAKLKEHGINSIGDLEVKISRL
jgi:hypothetical protein